MDTPARTQVYIAYVKREDDSNTLMFADDPKRDELAILFKDPYTGRTKMPFDGDMSPLDDDACYEVTLSQNSVEAMESQYVTLSAQVGGLSDYEPALGDEGGLQPIRVIYSFDGQKLVFKRIPGSKRINENRIISVDGEPRITDTTSVIAIDDTVDAVYHVPSKKFYFTDFQAAKHVFGTLEVYYRSATQNEVDEWLDEGMFDIDSQFDTFAISTPNRKRIALARDELKIDITDAEIKERILSYAGLHAPRMLVVNGKFNIKKNSDLTEALRFITGAYYRNEITGDLMVAGTPKKAN